MKINEAYMVISTFPPDLKRIVMDSRHKMLMGMTRKFHLDMVLLDDTLAKRDPDYDNEKCLYKGETASMEDYIVKKYGKKIAEKIKILITCK